MENHGKLGRGRVINRGISCTGEVLALKCIEVRKEAFPQKHFNLLQQVVAFNLYGTFFAAKV